MEYDNEGCEVTWIVKGLRLNRRACRGESKKMAESATQGIRRECKVGTGNGMQMWKG